MKNVLILVGDRIGTVTRVSDSEAQKMVNRKEAKFVPKSHCATSFGKPEPSLVHHSHPRVRRALGDVKKKGK